MFADICLKETGNWLLFLLKNKAGAMDAKRLPRRAQCGIIKPTVRQPASAGFCGGTGLFQEDHEVRK